MTNVTFPSFIEPGLNNEYHNFETNHYYGSWLNERPRTHPTQHMFIWQYMTALCSKKYIILVAYCDSVGAFWLFFTVSEKRSELGWCQYVMCIEQQSHVQVFVTRYWVMLLLGLLTASYAFPLELKSFHYKFSIWIAMLTLRKGRTNYT